MKKKICLNIDESTIMMLEELTDIITPLTKLSKSSATEYCIRMGYHAVRKVDQEYAEKENKQSS